MSIGAAKSATTWLYQMFKDHQDIYFSPEKEIHYFAHANTRDWNLNYKERSKTFTNQAQWIEKVWLKNLTDEEFKQYFEWYARYLSEPVNDEWYMNLFSDRGGKKYVADFSNSTCFINRRGCRHLKRSFDTVKLVYTLRDPVDRLWSHVKFHLMWTGKSHLLESYTDDDFIKLANRRNFIINSLYVKNITNFAKTFDESQFKILFFEDTINNPIAVLNEIEDFLGIDQRPYITKSPEKPINKGVPRPIPDTIKHAFREILDKQYSGLIKMGFTLPKTWNLDI